MHNRPTFFLCAALLALPSFASESLRVTPAAPNTTDKFSLQVFAPGCTAGLPVITSSTTPPRIDILVTAAACPILPFPVPIPVTGPTVMYLPFAPRPAGDYHVTVRLRNGASELILNEG